MSVAVSILLPVYNGEKYLEEAILSVIGQTFSDFELLVVDDCSTDRSVAIIERLKEKDSRIKFFKNEKNQGLFANYNRCIEYACGRFVKPFAQDDILAPTALEKMIALMEKDASLALVSSACKIVDGQGKVSRTRSTFPDSRKIKGKDVVLYNLLAITNWIGEPSTVMYRKELSGTGFDTRLFHYGDLDMWFRVLFHGDYYFINEPLASFRRHSGSATNKNLDGLLFALDAVVLAKTYAEILREIGVSDELYMRCVAEYAALQVDELVRTNGLTVQEVIDSARKGSRIGLSGDDNLIASQLMDAFVELSFYTLRSLTLTLRDLSDVQCRLQSDKEYLSRRLDHMEKSTSWRLTAPIRKLLSQS